MGLRLSLMYPALLPLSLVGEGHFSVCFAPLSVPEGPGCQPSLSLPDIFICWHIIVVWRMFTYVLTMYHR
jgi:hypothetical protein